MAARLREDAGKAGEIPAETFHHARTRNYAASLANGEILVYLAADAFPASENWLRALLANFEDEKVGAVYGRHMPKAGSSFERKDALGALYGEERVVKEPATRQRLGYRYYLMSTVNAAIRRNVWAATKFPEELKVFEDLGIAKRILDAAGKSSMSLRRASITRTNIRRWGSSRGTSTSDIRSGSWGSGTRAPRRRLLQDAWKLVRRKVARIRRKWERTKSAGFAEPGPGEVGGDVPGIKRKISAA